MPSMMPFPSYRGLLGGLMPSLESYAANPIQATAKGKRRTPGRWAEREDAATAAEIAKRQAGGNVMQPPGQAPVSPEMNFRSLSGQAGGLLGGGGASAMAGGGSMQGDPLSQSAQPPQAGLLGGWDSPQTQGMLGLSAGLLQAGGWSATPTTMGDAMGQGLQGAMQGMQAGGDMQARQQQMAMQQKRFDAADKAQAGEDARNAQMQEYAATLANGAKSPEERAYAMLFPKEYAESKMKGAEPQDPLVINGQVVDRTTLQPLADFRDKKALGGPKPMDRPMTAQEKAEGGLDPSQPYWRDASGGKPYIPDMPKDGSGGASYGDIITGTEAQKLGLDPTGAYQRNTKTGEYDVKITPKAGADSKKPAVQMTREAKQAAGVNPDLPYFMGDDGLPKLPDMGSKDTSIPQGYEPNPDKQGEYRPIAGGPADLEKRKVNFEQEAKLRGEFTTQTAPFRNMEDNFGKIAVSAKELTGPGAMALVYSFIKGLDDATGVRDPEVNQAMGSAGTVESLKQFLTKFQNGDSMPPAVRDQIVNISQKLYDVSRSRRDKIAKQYTSIAEKKALDSSQIISDPASPPAYTPFSQPIVAPRIGTAGGGGSVYDQVQSLLGGKGGQDNAWSGWDN